MNTKKAELRGRSDRPSRSPGSIKPTAISAASMGKALVFFATSCAAFQRSGSMPLATRPQLVASGSSQFRESGSRTRSFGRVVALQYRNGDEDQVIDMLITDPGAVAKHVSTGAKRRVPTGTPSWMFPLRLLPSSSATTEIDERQVAMDDYLAYVEKRHERLHQGVLSRPRVVPDSSRMYNSLTNPSYLRAVDRFGFTLNTFHRVNAAFASSLRVVTRMILLDNSGMSVACLATLFMARSVLKGSFRQA